MFSTCRTLQTGLILLALGACSKEPATPVAPLVTAPAQARDASADAQPTVTESVSSHVNVAGVAATYDATFAAGQLQSIVEQRADAHSAEYQFRGARLLHYRGSGLANPETIELRFDLQGALTLAKAGSGTVPAEEISAIRERAQLLRSHALAQRSTRDHH
ncbi:MAG TPA: hypothetical protein VJQ52_01725 [Steroidobacteraceae bacterium]|nr:hypothetical protein [Steroidobacteraceae bacterium]